MEKLPNLTTEQAALLLQKYGKNQITDGQKLSLLNIFLNQVKNPLIIILLLASVITFFLGDFIDTAVILAAVLVNILLGSFQEYKAEKTLLSLKKIITPHIKVIRDNIVKTISFSLLVPGDLVILFPGDKIPADGKLLEAVNLFINEALLTGESMPVEKDLQEKKDVFMGTTVASGRGKMILEKTGMDTRLGSIAQNLKESKEELTPLQKQLAVLAKQLSVLVIGLSFLIFFIGLLSGENTVSMFTTSVAVAVSAIPEGMVISLTAILALGMQRIMKKKALVRKLVAAETLGSVTTICVDKTGTLTEGIMKVSKEDLLNKDLVVKTAILANNLEDPLEIALWDWARGKNNLDPQELLDQTTKTAEIPFNSENKYLAVATLSGIFIKGAPEILLDKSNLNPQEKQLWQEKVENLSREGLRTLAFAYKNIHINNNLEKEINNLTFLGLVGIEDPVREGVKESIRIAHQEGIGIKVLTGDYRGTAYAVLKKIGLEINNPEKEIMEGIELKKISTEELEEKIKEIKLFCRITPDQKLKIVAALQKVGEVVAMTGDGVNDAPAIKKADIGIVVEKASEVAKETADLILLDSNFKTITAAVEEGRGLFINIRKVVLYLLADVFVEIFVIAGSIIMRLPLPFTASQILWVNLIDDGLPNLALTIDPVDRSLIKHKPRQKDSHIVNKSMKIMIGVVSITASSFILSIFIWALYFSGRDYEYARTMAFTMLGVDSLIHVFSTKNLKKHLFASGFNNNLYLYLAVLSGLILQIFAIYHPLGKTLFQTVSLNLFDWTIILSCSILLVAIIELVKYLLLKDFKKQERSKYAS